MRFGITVWGERIAPRSTQAEAFVVLVVNGCNLVYQKRFPHPINNRFDLLAALKGFQIETLICGGNSVETRDTIESLGVSIVANVACSVKEAVRALQLGVMESGYGLSGGKRSVETGEAEGAPLIGLPGRRAPVENVRQDRISRTDRLSVDCFTCEEKRCLLGQQCGLIAAGEDAEDRKFQRVLDAATDISLEPERALCRVSEFVYFALEMEYKKVGIAFCVDLFEQTTILARVLARFFQVFSVCCRVGKTYVDTLPVYPDSGINDFDVDSAPCNPVGQAEILNRFGSDINIIAGLCVGMDCIFAEVSQAPATALFVKDKMLANNPVAAVYSDFYLEEIARQGFGRNR